jgi:hypothetical protein
MAENSSVNSPEAPVESKEEESQKTTEEKSVDYSTHRKLLDEKKKEKARVKELEAKLAEIEEGKLEEEKRYKELFEKRDSELKELQKTLEESKKSKVQRDKLDAFNKAVGGLKNESYSKLVDLDKIIIEDGVVNEASLVDYATEFKKKHPELIDSKPAPSQLPSEAPKGMEKKPSLKGMSSKDILEQIKTRYKK